MGSSVHYDPSVIVEQADRLYRQARTIVIFYSVIGLITGGVVGGGLSASMTRSTPSEIAILITAIVGCFIGISVGREKAFRLRLQAQQALCQVQIETNTRAKAA